MHAIAAFCLLFIYNGHTVNLMMQVRSVPSDVKVKLVSFNRRVALSQKGKSKGVSRSVASKPSHKASADRGKIVKKKAVSKKSIANKKTVIAKKTIVKKTVAKKVIPKLKPVVTKAIPAKKPIVAKKLEQKKEVVKEEPKKIIEKKVETKPVEEKQVEKAVIKEDSVEVEDNVYEVADQREFDALQLQALFQESVAEVWTPPLGMVDTIECIVTVSVDWKGNIIERKIDKKSGVLVYDMTVEHALNDLKIPRAAWGKSMTVAFKP
jgi:hypothetical protein